MKTTLQFLIFLFAFNAFAQISLEQTYSEGYITRIKLENSGEKYYLFNYETKEVVFYNNNHTVWKRILLPIVNVPSPYFSSVNITHISENKINPDSNIEIVYTNTYSNETGFYAESRVISENGTTLLTVLDSSRLYFSEINGGPNKLIADFFSNTNSTNIYNLPGLNLEHSYLQGRAKRVLLEKSGEKYILLDIANGVAKIYNSNHSLWKTVSTPFPALTYNSDISFVSENQINTDSDLEIGYIYFNNVNKQYEGRIVNEKNEILMTFPNASILSISQIDGFPNKLLVYLIDSNNYNTDVYGLPSLTLENNYTSGITRTKFEISGEKYFSTYPRNGSIELFNSNHKLWKTIDSNIPIDYKLNIVDHISETKINSDNLLELSCIYSKEEQLESKIINENGIVLLSVPGAEKIYLSEMSGLENKLIADVRNGYDGKVYKLNNSLEVSNIVINSNLIISPNPAKYHLNINSLSLPIIEATIYDMNGALVKKEIAQNITKIDVDKLPMGIYIVNLTDFNNQKSTHKITIVH